MMAIRSKTKPAAAVASNADHDRVIVRKMPPHVADAVKAIIVGQMASSLILRRADLADEAACRDVLVRPGYGTDRINNLLTRAIEAARAH
ncbi:hypothetical protein PE067_07535 [Paracoccus sp. DMF-8]|uniref:hypothetical protein n=1 Tax=Paracoccus sp. DMF-8 TaxID=3019445 RepID=UPI0023E8428D|nr:hypothetical protein [Paracoccus sp. DMF-8]MDF3605996.1 hypothetical protein [Paracoccus sp. DMF-8]